MNSATDPAKPKGVPLTIELERGGKILRVTWLGEITLAAMKEGFSRTREFAKGRELLGAISDFSCIESFNMSADDVYALTSEEPVFETEIPRVTVSGRDHVFGMARMFELMSDGRSKGIHVVHTIEEAYSLLRLDDPEFYPVNTD